MVMDSPDDISVDSPIRNELLESLPVFSPEYFDNEPILNIGDHLTADEANVIRIEINNCYIKPIDVEVEPYDFEMCIRITSDVPFHCAPRRLSYFQKNEHTIDELLR